VTFLSWLYAFGYRVRRFFLSLRGLRPEEIQGALVVSVGNLAAGGNGKTPLALEIGRYFSSRGRKVAFLTRGYRRRGTQEPHLVDGSNPSEASEAGDEPLLLALNSPKASVLVDRDRVRSGRQAVAQGAQVLVLDDGFQQRLFIRRDLDLLLWDARVGDRELKLLPAGMLREPLAEGASADALVVTGCASLQEAESLRSRLGAALEGKPLYWAGFEPTALADLVGQKKPASILKNKKVAAVSGLARPEKFEGTLAGLGAKVVSAHRFGDHHAYSVPELKAVESAVSAQDLAIVVTTEKDAVRLPKEFQPSLTWLVLKVRLVVEPKKRFEDLMETAWKKKISA
jgi:tetraacyldisaccharide 4'-kinase